MTPAESKALGQRYLEDYEAEMAKPREILFPWPEPQFLGDSSDGLTAEHLEQWARAAVIVLWCLTGPLVVFGVPHASYLVIVALGAATATGVLKGWNAWRRS